MCRMEQSAMLLKQVVMREASSWKCLFRHGVRLISLDSSLVKQAIVDKSEVHIKIDRDVGASHGIRGKFDRSKGYIKACSRLNNVHFCCEILSCAKKNELFRLVHDLAFCSS